MSDKHTLEFLYADENHCCFMDPENFEQTEIPKALIGVQARFLEAGMRLTVEFVAGRSKEFFDLFIGLGRGELLPYASYYLTGFLHERPLARVREDLDLLGIERAGSSREPEDHSAILLEVMAGLARGDFEAEFAEQARFFERHLKPIFLFQP